MFCVDVTNESFNPEPEATAPNGYRAPETPSPPASGYPSRGHE